MAESGRLLCLLFLSCLMFWFPCSNRLGSLLLSLLCTYQPSSDIWTYCSLSFCPAVLCGEVNAVLSLTPSREACFSFWDGMLLWLLWAGHSGGFSIWRRLTWYSDLLPIFSLFWFLAFFFFYLIVAHPGLIFQISPFPPFISHPFIFLVCVLHNFFNFIC